MIKNLKYISQNFALKVNKRSKKCNTINYTTEFYQNLILIQKEKILQLFQNKNLIFNPDFCISTYKINDILDDGNLDLLIADKITKNVNTSGIKSDSTFYSLFKTFYENLKNNPDHPLTKELLTTLNHNSFLFSHNDKNKLEKLLKEEKKKDGGKQKQNLSESSNDNYNEKESTPELEEESANIHEENGRKFMQNFAKIKIMDDNVKIYLDSGNKKVTIRSKHFDSKIKIMGIDDNKIESVYKAFKYVDKHTPNILLLQRRPVHFEKTFLFDSDENLDNNSNEPYYSSLLEREDIMSYCKNNLSSQPEYKINSVERIVYEEIDTFKTMSFAQSLILKSNYALNLNPQIKIILTDIPIFSEIENILNNVLKTFNPKDFFLFMKLNLLFEKYSWLTETCINRCPLCDKHTKFDSAHLSLEKLIEDFLITYQGIEYIKIKNMSDKIIKSIKLGDFKGNNIVAFVEDKFFYLVIERLVKDINTLCDGKDFDTVEKMFVEKNKDYAKEFKSSLGDLELLVKNYSLAQSQSENANNSQIYNSKNEVINKLAICLNVFENKKVFQNSKKFLPEIDSLKEEIKAPLQELYKQYNEKLNYVDEINLWSNRKYDYKCFPNEFLINKHLETTLKK